MSSSAARQWALLAVIFLAAVAIRVAPAWQAVYGGEGVNFQGGDPYYHLRSIEALAANYPWRPGFDPYGLYPKGMNVPTGPLFDYAVATAALAIGLGSPSAELVEHVAAWFPPLIGALGAWPAFLLARELLNRWAGLIAAAWMAVCGGHTVVYAKLGFADHHVFEALFYGLALFGLAVAVRRDGLSARWALLGGLAIGCALLNRPAAAFLGPLFGGAAALLVALDLYVGRVRRYAWTVAAALLIGWLFLLPAGAGAWGRLPHLAMAAGAGAALAGWGLAEWVRRKGWPLWTWPAAAVLLASAGLAVSSMVWPATLQVLADGWTDAIRGGEARLVGEVRSLLRADGRWSLRPVLAELGPAGLVALPAFAVMGLEGGRTRDRALLLTAAAGAVLYGAALLQARMAIYAAFHVAVAVGWCVWKLLDGQSPVRRIVRGLAAVLLLFPLPLVLGIDLAGRDSGMTEDWRSAMRWLRENTPEPLGDPEAFLRYYPRLEPGQSFAYPPGAYGVMVWWDRGYWVLARGRRAPVSNGTQNGAHEAARFFTSTQPAEALAMAAELGARYVIVDPAIPAAPYGAAGPGNSQFRAMTGWTDRPLRDFIGLYNLPLEGGGAQPVIVFYPEYFRSMASRLYLHDGRDYEPRQATTVFALREGEGLKTISSQRTFGTYEQARRYMDARPDQNLLLGTMDPYKSCVPLEAVEGLSLVFNSRLGPVVGKDGKIRAVKIFERTASGREE